MLMTCHLARCIRRHRGCESVGFLEGMASKRKQQSDELKSLIDDQRKRFDERLDKQGKKFEDLLEKQSKQFEERFEKLQDEIKEIKTDLRSSRRETRRESYCRMLNVYLNMVLFIKLVYAGKSTSDFKDADSCKDRLTHPQSIVELRDEARLFWNMLESHKTKGDELDTDEIKFLDVFCKIDEIF
jgi:hypothetical protein